MIANCVKTIKTVDIGAGFSYMRTGPIRDGFFPLKVDLGRGLGDFAAYGNMGRKGIHTKIPVIILSVTCI